MVPKFREYKVWISDVLATLHSAKLSDYNYLILFNIEEHKHFIDAFKAFGFYTYITKLGEEQTDFVPISPPNNKLLTNEIMASIWNEIKERGLPD